MTLAKSQLVDFSAGPQLPTALELWGGVSNHLALGIFDMLEIK